MTSFKLITPYFTRNRRTIAFGLLFLLIVDFLQLWIPRVIKWAVDDLTLLQADAGQLAGYAWWIVGLSVGIGIFRYGWRRRLIGLSRQIEEGLRNQLLAHLQTLSMSYFDTARSGELMAHATNDIQNIRMATGMGIVALTDAVVLGTASIAFMLYINVPLTLLVMLPMPAVVLGTRILGRRIHRGYQAVQGAFATTTETVRETISGIRIVKAYTREALAHEKLTAASAHYVAENLRLVRLTSLLFPMMLLFTNLSMLMIVLAGGRQTLVATITPGDFVAFINYLGLLTWPMMALGWMTNLIQRGKASLDRLQRILEIQPDICDVSGARPPIRVQDRVQDRTQDRTQGRISLEGVSFRYPQPSRNRSGVETSTPRDLLVLEDITLHLEPGRMLGLTGPPGGGKSTLLALLGRLYDVTRGRILLDGQDVRNWPVAALRAQMAYLSQEPFLFAGTLRENITFGASDMPAARLEKALEQARLTETVREFPDGLETLVGERGVLLSGGQKQRLALARALVRQVPVLLLDDPVSQVDMETGAAIIQNLQTLPEKPTILMVSQRLAALRNADEIVVLKEGRILERGRHLALSDNQGYYARTWRLQELEAIHAG